MNKADASEIIKIIYDSNSKRPKKFLVEYKISNEPTVQMIFNN